MNETGFNFHNLDGVGSFPAEFYTTETMIGKVGMPGFLSFSLENITFLLKSFLARSVKRNVLSVDIPVFADALPVKNTNFFAASSLECEFTAAGHVDFKIEGLHERSKLILPFRREAFYDPAWRSVFLHNDASGGVRRVGRRPCAVVEFGFVKSRDFQRCIIPFSTANVVEYGRRTGGFPTSI